MPNIKFYQLLSVLLLLWPSLSISKLELRSPLFSISIGNTGDLTGESSEAITLMTEINTREAAKKALNITKINNHSFKVEIDAEASRHLFPSNERLKN